MNQTLSRATNKDLLSARYYEERANELKAELSVDPSNTSATDLRKVEKIFEEIQHEETTAYAKAAEYYENAAKIEMESKDLWEKAGDIYIEADQPQKALEPYKKAMSLLPDNKLLLKKIAEAYFKAAFKAAFFESENKQGFLHQVKSNEYFLRGTEPMRRYLDAVQSDQSGWKSLGDAYSHLKDFDAARECYANAFQYSSGVKDYWFLKR